MRPLPNSCWPMAITSFKPSKKIFNTACLCKRAGSQPLPSKRKGEKGNRARALNRGLCLAQAQQPTDLTGHRARHELDSLYHATTPLGHLSQTLFECSRLLQGVSRHRCQRRTILRIPFLVLLLSCGPVRFARTIGGHVECLDLVDVVVIHAPLGEDILAPGAPLPIAAIVCAGCEHGVALLQVPREHFNCPLGDDLQVAEEAVLDVRTVLVVEAVRRISWLGAQPSPQTLRDKDGVGV